MMKKTFLVALLVLTVCSAAFAVEQSTVLGLDLTGATSNLHAGFYDAKGIAVDINNATASSDTLNIGFDNASLMSQDKYFTVFWHLNAIEGTGEHIKLEVNFEPLANSGDIIEYRVLPAPETPAVIKQGQIVEADINTSFDLDIDGEGTDEKHTVFDKSSEYGGLSIGYLIYHIPSFNVSAYKKAKYTANITLTINTDVDS